MKRERYINICQATISGKDSFVRHEPNGEEGLVESCTHEHLLVKTSDGSEKVWDYRDCDKLERS